jgi:hypothetical protein
MKEDIKNFSRIRPIIEILHFLENKYKRSVDYNNLYYEFRKMKPLFGKDDCAHFYEN